VTDKQTDRQTNKQTNKQTNFNFVRPSFQSREQVTFIGFRFTRP
jgi:hypothetical protein